MNVPKTEHFSITPTFQMKKPNEKLFIHSGEFRLRNNNKTFRLNGDIIFKWFPNISIEFDGILQVYDEHGILFDLSKHDVIVEGQEIGCCIIT